MKSSPLDIVRAHRDTYVDASTGKRRFQDMLVVEWFPVVLGVIVFVFDVKLETAASVGLLTVTGLMSAFLFGAMLQISSSALDWADTDPRPGRDTSDHAKHLGELAANSGYASLMSILASLSFVVCSFASETWLRLFTALGVVFGLHTLLVLLMVMKRVFGITISRLNRARTGQN